MTKARRKIDGLKVRLKKTKIGHEIPFTREFYKYVAPRRSEDISPHLQEIDQREQELMTKIMRASI